MLHQDSLVKGQSESFSKYVSQFTLLVSEAHGGTCPEKKCGADISIKMNVRRKRILFACVFFIVLFIRPNIRRMIRLCCIHSPASVGMRPVFAAGP
jgi:hypothetical protein